ncbi:MAG: hypothetical protein Tp138OMZ00d2C19078221_49 [Prokaryotic dsDNA virus sp.]|jgi:hypothetical protein|nr:hypothetical protein [Pseudomonadales bacterium]QDP67477.1 MAG: hypothetical protein Tp138OMZ00d2C19078221_49 [Prokaryotic dsDNA virus sp.]|tara:strand:- start:21381 stop:21791 length:411 start_codon:yes stop_codon:yes gene_type:complete
MTKTVYSDELLDKVREYIQVWPEIPLKSGRKRMIPGVEGLAQYLGIGRQTMYDWRKRDDMPEFNALVDEMMGDQLQELENGGLSKDMDNKTVALLLSRHGVVMKKELDHTSSDGSMSPAEMTDEELDRRIAAYLNK